MSKFSVALPLKKTALALAAALCLLPAAWAGPADQSFTDMVAKFVLVPPGAPETEMLAKASSAVAYMQRMELPQASHAINEALQLAPSNAQLHFLNAFIYHLQAKQGDAQKFDMAIEGYQQALRIDPGNWIAQEFLGLAFLDHGRFADAKAQFSEVLLMTPDSAVSLNGLMTASYLTGDAVTACVMADKLRAVQAGTAAAEAGFLRSSVAVFSACGEFDKAAQMRARLAQLGTAGGNLDRVDRRMAQWKSFYAENAALPLRPASLKSGASASDKDAILLAQAFTVPNIKLPPRLAADAPQAPASPAATAAATATAATAATPATPAPVAAPAAEAASAAAAVGRAEGGPRMVLVDVVLVSAQDQLSTSKGVNLLNALTLQLGSIAGNLAAFSRAVTDTTTTGAPGNVTTTITRAVTVPALSYSLNIANANNAVNEVLARPTLAAIEGMPSEFFSGTNLSAGVVSASAQGGTTIVPLEKRFGIKLAVTPTFLSNNRVQLKVEAQRTSLNASVDNPRVAYQIESGEITANANVVMNLGDTLVLSGLSEKSTARTRDGVPVLQDVPGLQYLFSNQKTNDVQRSVLMLITPRTAAYTQRSGVDQSAGADPAVTALRARFGFTGDTPANTDLILSHLASNVMFRQFRQGDVAIERWDRADSTGERLRQALEFLYY